jgi:hypothetical protein
VLLDYHSLVNEEQQAPAVVWVPLPPVRTPPSRVRPEPVPEPEPERQVIHATMDVSLPMVEVRIAAHATQIPPTPVTEVDLDAIAGETEDDLIVAAALLLLEDDD